MSLRTCFFILFVWLLPNLASYGRTDYLSQSYNPHGNNPIKRAYVLYAREVTRDIYLDARQNQPCFMRGREISKVLLDGVKNKLLLPYKDDTFEEVMSEADFLKRLQISDEEGGLPNAAHEFFPHQISILRLVEHVIFNKITARQEYDIESIELIVPGKKNPPTYLDHTIAIFKYKDVIDYFNKLPFDLVCWYNAANPAESLTWADAFDLRLFLSGSRIVKASNLGDAMVDEIYEKTPGDGKGLIMSEKLAVEVDIELETFMSEY